MHDKPNAYNALKRATNKLQIWLTFVGEEGEYLKRKTQLRDEHGNVVGQLSYASIILAALRAYYSDFPLVRRASDGVFGSIGKYAPSQPYFLRVEGLPDDQFPHVTLWRVISKNQVSQAMFLPVEAKALIDEEIDFYFGAKGREIHISDVHYIPCSDALGALGRDYSPPVQWVAYQGVEPTPDSSTASAQRAK